MATVNPVFTDLSGNRQVVKFTWELTTTNRDGAPIGDTWCEYADRTVYMIGTWGAGPAATVVWQGGDGTTYLTFTDPQGNSISKTSDGTEAVTELMQFSRPNMTATGAGTGTITVTAILRRGFKRG